MAAAQAIPSLQSVLQRADVWRGDRLAQAHEAGVASGFATLDAELPGGGWPRGALTELLSDSRGIGELSLLMPALGACAARAPVALLAPPFAPHAPAWSAVLPLERLLLVEAGGADVAWAAEALLGSGALGAMLLYLPAKVDARSLRRLQLAAEAHAAPVFLFRSLAAARSASPAVLRLTLQGCAAGLQVGILKRRGPPCTQRLLLEVPRPARQSRLAERLQTPVSVLPLQPVGV